MRLRQLIFESRSRPRTISLLLCLALWVAFPLAGRDARGEKPNIVMIMVDDASYNSFGFNQVRTGGDAISEFETPNLDALAAQSVVMSSGYVSAPLCAPTRAGLMTGQYQQRFGYENNISNSTSGTDGLQPSQRTIAKELKNLGYTNGAIGKWHMGAVDGVNRPLDMGFDEFYGFLGGGRPYWGMGSANAVSTMRRNNTPIESVWVNEGDQSRYDPVNGRYATDAFGEEAADFIDRNADEPFFLYVAPHAPHSPSQNKQQDLDRFAHIEDDFERIKAAMIFAVDRAVGDITQALEVNDLADDTIVVFMNDNGGVFPGDNWPYFGHKGQTWEGSVRVPFVIKGPGVEAGIYDSPVSVLDLMPTFVAAAEGDVSQLDTDGVDLMPFISGDVEGDPHEVLHWRSVDSRYAIRKGDWKIMQIPPFTRPRLFNLATDRRERTDLFGQHPDIVAELVRELTYWEATLDKPRWGNFGSASLNGAPLNQFDHFVFRNDIAPSADWSSAGNWIEGGTTNVVSLREEDGYPNAILEFTTSDDGDYTARNDLLRATLQIFMVNELRFTGSFAGAADRTGTVDGNPLLLVDSLTGQAPQLRLDATAAGTSNVFEFQVDAELQLLHDLEITGNGTQNFVIDGNIRDYFEPRGVTKTGTSQVTFRGQNTFAGILSIQAGEVAVSGPTAAVQGASEIVIGSAGTLSLDEGTISVGNLDNSHGGSFDFTGGALNVATVQGDLQQNGGLITIGDSPGTTAVDGDFEQIAGALEIEIGGPLAGTDYDQLQVVGAAALAGSINVALLNDYMPVDGQLFTVITATSVEDNGLLLAGDDAAQFNLLVDSSAILLQFVAALMAGDLNGDGVINFGDLSPMAQAVGDPDTYQAFYPDLDRVALCDVNGDSECNFGDLSPFVNLLTPPLASGDAAVPEPATVSLLACVLLASLVMRSRTVTSASG